MPSELEEVFKVHGRETLVLLLRVIDGLRFGLVRAIFEVGKIEDDLGGFGVREHFDELDFQFLKAGAHLGLDAVSFDVQLALGEK